MGKPGNEASYVELLHVSSSSPWVWNAKDIVVLPYGA